MNDNRVYNDPSSGNIQGSADVQADRQTTELEDYAHQLEILLNGLERAALQYENMVNRLRGPQPSGGEDMTKRAEVNSTMARMHGLMDSLNAVSSKLNNAADELGGIV